MAGGKTQGRMFMEFSYICSECGKGHPITPELMVCPECSARQTPDKPLLGVMEIKLRGKARPDFEVHSLLPVPKEFFPPLPVGDTPLWHAPNLRKELGFKNLYFKDDGKNPTSSFKDRASYLVSAFARMHKINELCLASTGNAGSSMAGVGAAAGQKVVLFLPHTAPKAKLVQALQYGATVYRVNGTYDQAYDLSLEYSVKFGGMSRSTAFNPMTLEGKKTVSLEIFQQLKKAPEHVFVPTGDGCILGGVYKGFKDLVELGLIQEMPTVHCVQAENSNAINRALKNGDFDQKPSSTIADSISVDIPRNGYYALKQLKKYQGNAVNVTDQEIKEAQKRLSSSTGLFTEPAGAAAFAGLLKIKEDLNPKDTIVVLATGSGLKDILTAGSGVDVPEKTIESLDEI